MGGAQQSGGMTCFKQLHGCALHATVAEAPCSQQQCSCNKQPVRLTAQTGLRDCKLVALTSQQQSSQLQHGACSGLWGGSFEAGAMYTDVARGDKVRKELRQKCTSPPLMWQPVMPEHPKVMAKTVLFSSHFPKILGACGPRTPGYREVRLAPRARRHSFAMPAGWPDWPKRWMPTRPN
jgi:hypothetical protein